MAAVIEHPAEKSDQLQRRALEQMLESLVTHVVRLIDSAETTDQLATREAALQLEAFDERRRQAMSYLASERNEPDWLRVGNLERHVEALQCSREFFGRLTAVTAASEPMEGWSVLVR